jgi:hypothetical protein
VALLELGVLRAVTWRQESMPIEEGRARRVLSVDVEGKLWGRPSLEADDTRRVEVADSADGCPGLNLHYQTGWPSQDWKWRRAADLTWLFGCGDGQTDVSARVQARACARSLLTLVSKHT